MNVFFKWIKDFFNNYPFFKYVFYSMLVSLVVFFLMSNPIASYGFVYLADYIFEKFPLLIFLILGAAYGCMLYIFSKY